MKPRHKPSHLHLPTSGRALAVLVAALFTALFTAALGRAQPAASPALAAILAGGQPQSVAEFKALEGHVQALLQKVLPCTVSLGGASAVLIEGGYVLSAGHVTKQPGKTFSLILHDGRRVQARSLGLCKHTDSGLLKITSAGGFPGLQMGRSSTLKVGQWVMMLGFPGGRQSHAQPPVRLGRVLRVVAPGQGYLTTDCTMSAGDSGGPLFDMQGRVIGTNSRINRNLEANMHVPIDAFRRGWEWLLAGEVLDRRPPVPGWLGLVGEREGADARIDSVVADSPAARAGIQPGDLILRYGRRKVRSPGSMARLTAAMWPGDEVRITLRRGAEQKVLTATVGRAPALASGPEIKDQPADTTAGEKRESGR